MVATCPSCTTRYRLDASRFVGKRLTLRCHQCREIFKAEISSSVSGLPVGISALVAHSDAVLCQTVRDLLVRGGVACHICHNGKDLLALQKKLQPDVVVLDVALPGLFVFEAVDALRCENQQKKLSVILVSSVFKKTAYKRAPVSLYGADEYIEKHHIPGDLLSMVYRLAGKEASHNTGTELAQSHAAAYEQSEKKTGALSCRQYVDQLNDRLEQAENDQASVGPDDALISKMRRLAQVIVSDIALYNQDKIEEGIAGNNVHETLSNEIMQGQQLFVERFPAYSTQAVILFEEALLQFIASRRQELNF